MIHVERVPNHFDPHFPAFPRVGRRRNRALQPEKQEKQAYQDIMDTDGLRGKDFAFSPIKTTKKKGTKVNPGQISGRRATILGGVAVRKTPEAIELSPPLYRPLGENYAEHVLTFHGRLHRLWAVKAKRRRVRRLLVGRCTRTRLGV